jgi:HEAT repeat protein
MNAAQLCALVGPVIVSVAVPGCGHAGSERNDSSASQPMDGRNDEATSPAPVEAMNRSQNPAASDIAELIRTLHASDEDARHDAALALGTIGTPECVAPILEALTDDDDYLRSYAMMGIKRGMEAKRCKPEFLNAVFPALVKLLDRDDKSVGGDAPELLLAIDRDRAITSLLSSEYFTVTNRELHFILRALNQVSHQIPRDKLLPLLAELKPLSNKYPHDYQYAETLIAYAINPDADAEKTFRGELESSNKEVQEAAAAALAIHGGVRNARQHVFQELNKHGFEKLTSQQKHYHAVFIYNAEVNNGGHSQYFFNTSGDEWKFAMAGLSAIGAGERAKILGEAVAAFGPAGPSETRSLRQDQLAKFDESTDKLLDRLDDRYYASKENIEVRLSLYALANKVHFTTNDEGK